MPNDKISNLYKTFVSDGYEMESEEEFRKNLSDKDRRKSAYDALVKDGYDMEPYEEFEANLGFGSDNSEGSVSNQVTNEYDKSVRNNQAGEVPSSPYVGRDSNGNVTVFGVPYDEYMKMPKEKQSEAYSNAIEQRKSDNAAEMRKHLEETGQLARLDEAEKKAQEVIDKKGGDFPLAEGVFGGVAAIPDIVRYIKSRFFDSEARAAYATREKAREAKELVEEAGHAGNGWLDKQIGGVARGAVEGATDEGTWDFGATGVADAYTLNDIYTRLKKGEKITSAEQGLLDIYGLASAVEEAYSDQVGMGYKVGRSLPESAGFMASMAINPASGLAKAAVKKYGTSTVKKIAARVLGDAAEMGAMTVTTGAGRVAEDFYNRLNGRTEFDIDNNGIIRYGGQSEQEQASSAIFKALGSNYIENYSESLGEYFSPLGGFLKGITSSGLRKAGLGKLVDAVGDIKSSQWSKGIQEFKDKTKFNGFIGEYMEEVSGNFMNAATVGDMNFNSPEDPRSVFNLETNIETALSCALMSGTLYGVEAAGSKGGKAIINRKMRNAERAAEDAFAKGTGNPDMSWDKIRDGMDKATPDGLKEMVSTILADSDLSAEQKKAACNYALNLMKYQGFNSRTAQNHEEQTDEAKEAEAAYDEGTTMQPEQRYSAENSRVSAGDALRAVDEGLADTIDRLVADDAGAGEVEEVISGVEGEEKARLAREYYNASMRVAGVIDNAREEADDEVDAYEESIRPFVYEDSDGNRMVTTAVYGDNADEEVHVVDNDGTYAAIIRADGTKEMVAADKLRNVMTRPADEMVQEYRDNVYAERKAQTEMSLNNHPKTKPAEPGMTLWNGDNAMIVAEVGDDGTVRAYPAVLDVNTGKLAPKNGSAPVDMTMLEAMELQNDYYNRMDAAENGGISNQEESEKKDGSLHPKAQEEKPLSLDETNGPTGNGNQPALLGIDSPAVSDGKYTDTSSEKQADGTNSSIPIDEKGNPLYHTVPIEDTMNDILDGSLTDEEVDGFVSANIKEAESGLKKVSEKAPKIGTNKAKYLADKKAWQAKVDEAGKKVDYWKQVQDAVKESRVKPGDKTADEILSFGEPMDGVELAARELGFGNLPLLHDDYKRELGFGNKEAWSMFGLFKSRENGGLTIEEAGELLMQTDLEEGTNFFDQSDANAGRNAIIEVLSSVRTRGDLAGFIRNRREAMAERERNAEMEHDEIAREQWAQENFGMSYEDYAAYQEEIDGIIREKAIPDEAAQEFYDNFTNELNNSNNGRTEEEATVDDKQGDNGSGGSGERVLPEEQAGNAGGTGDDSSSGTDKRADNEGAPAQESASGSGGIAVSQENGNKSIEPSLPTKLSEIPSEWKDSRLQEESAVYASSPMNIPDDVFTEYTKSVMLPPVEKSLDRAIGASGKNVLIKRSIFAKNDITHGERYSKNGLTTDENRNILTNALYGGELTGRTQPASKPNYWVVIKQADNNSVVVLEVSDTKDNLEIVGWEYRDEKGLKNLYNQATKNGGEIVEVEKGSNSEDGPTLIQDSEESSAADLSALTSASVGKDNDSSSNNQTKGGFIAPQPEKGENIFDYADRVVKAKEIDDARKEVSPNPTESQKEAGNYKMGHVKIDGYDITIEIPKGNERSGTDANGNKWSVVMNNDYGYIRGTKGVDGDHIDVFLSDNPETGDVYVIDQYNPDGSFDEHKVMYGFADNNAARDAYLSNYEDGWGQTRRIDVTGVSKEEFRKWIDSSNRKTKPFAEYKSVKINEEINNETKQASIPNSSELHLAEQQNAVPDLLPTQGNNAFSTRDGSDQRAIDNEKPLLPTSETPLVHPLSDAKVPKMFESANVDGNNSKETDDSVLFRDSDKTDSKGENKELVAVHNISADNLKQAFELGGLPMPSIAITKADVGHTGFGDISLVFDKESINPADRRNKVYGEDAWTPMFPEVGYKLDDNKTSDIYRRANAAGNMPLLNPVVFHPDNYERYINSSGSESLVNHFKDSYGAKQLYLSETGSPVKRLEMHEVDKYPPEEISLYEKILKEIGIDRIKNEISNVPGNDLKRIIEEHYNIDLDKMEAFRATARVKRTINRVIDYAENGNRKTEQDIEATKKKIDERIDNKEFEAWLEELFAGVVLKKGIRNDKDPFTPSGTSRKWEQLYDDITLESVVDSMRKQSAQGGNGLFGGSIFGASQEELKSIDEIRKQAKERIRSMNDEEYESMRREITERLSNIKIKGAGDSVSDTMDMVENINDAVARSHTAKGIHKYLKGIYPDVTMETANEIEGIVKDIQKMSARYFEAKPYRAVGFDEVRLAVVPSDTDGDIVRELENRGIPVRTYERDNEEQRKRIVEEATEEMSLRFRDMQDLNGRFNEKLSGLTEDNADNVEFDLGSPSPVLRAAGVEDKSMKLYGNKVIKKMKKHGFKLEELRNLPGAVANPIAVFNNYGKEGNRSILTELKTEQGNFLVTITFGKGRDVDFNIVTSVFGKGDDNIITWINNGYATYINKNKTLDYLHHPAVKAETSDNREGKTQDSLFYQSAPIAATAAESELSDATKIVENFENPTIEDEISRDGYGNYSDDSLSDANDPASKLLGKSSRTARQRREFAERERRRMEDAARRMTEKLGLDNVEIVTDASGLEGRKSLAKGFYSPATGKITVVLPNHANSFDVEQTILHEAVAHYGLRRLFGDNFDTFLDNVYGNASAEVRDKIDDLAGKYNGNTRTATEEYLASLAEETNFEDMNAGWWSKIKELFLNMLHKVGLKGFNGVTLTDNELRYILWRSHENLANPGRYRNMFDTAADVVKQNELKVGNYAEPEQSTEAAAENDVLFRTSSVQELLEDWDKYVAESPAIHLINGEEDIDSLPYSGFSKRELREKLEDKRCTGAYSDRNGAIFLFPGHISGDASELELTLWHETAHYASRKYGLGESLKDACLEYVRNNYPETYKEITGYYDRSRWGEEAVAYLFEKKIKEFGAKKLLSSTFAGENDVAETFTQLINFIKNGKRSTELGRNSGSSGDKSGEKVERSVLGGRGNDVLDERRGGDGGGSGIFDDEELNIVNRETGAAREQYERTLDTASYKAREAWQDSMLGLKVLQDAVAKATRSRILDYENAYMAENALSSKSLAEMNAYRELVYKPLLKEIAELKKQGAKYSEITDYLIAKHGIERNREMAVRKALAEDGDTAKENIERWTEEKKAVWDDDSLSWREQQEKLDRIAESYGADMSADYSGLSSMFPNDDMEGTTDDAYKAVEEFEGRFETAPLIGKLNAATDAVLEKQLESGMMNKDTFDSIGGMYQFYVPLRGWEEKTADEVYDYLTTETSSFNAPVKKAKGRKSKADDPIATIANVAESGILQGNRNMMKQKFLIMAENHRSDLVSVSDLWLQYDAAKDEWTAVFPEIPEKASPEEVESIVSKFDERMKELSEKEPDRYKRSSDAKDIPYKILPRNMKEHQVIVKRGGKEYVLTINGNPRAAQALNGLTNPDSTDSMFVKFFDKINRFLAANFTARNPAFVISNLFRDAFYTNSTVWVKESPAYAMRYNRNWAKSLKEMGGLVSRYKAGKLDMSNPTDRMFFEFIQNGGETGYTFINSVEDYKGIIEKELKRMNRGKLHPANAYDVLGSAMDTFGRWAEDTSRFAAYMTSREEGRSVAKSVSDAKEISVNFNKKGAGKKTAGKFEKGNRMNAFQAGLSQVARGLYIFWNAGVQGLTNFGRLAKRNPGKFAGMAATYFTLGSLVPLMNAALASAMGGDGDEDDYYNLPEYVRRNNICIYAGGEWIIIPLPIEIRAIYGLGELASGVLSGEDNTSGGKLAMEVAKQVSGIMPIDVMEGEGGFSTFIPSYVKPFTEAYGTNKDWTGIPIYKDNGFNKDMPEWTKAYKSTSPELVELSETLNEWTGGNKYKKGVVNFNPARVEHLFESYLGGVGTTINQLKKSVMMPFDEDLQDVRNIPVVGRFIRSADSRSVQKRINDEYFDNRERFGKMRQELNGYRKEMANPKSDIFEQAKYRKLYNDLVKSEEFRKYVEFEEMEKRLKKMLDAFKVSGDEELEKNMYLLKEAMNEVAK